MSLFGSIYEEAGDSPGAPSASPAPTESAGGPTDDAPGSGAGSSSMSLQDFAAEVFGSGPPRAQDSAGETPDDGPPSGPTGPNGEALSPRPAQDPLEALAQVAEPSVDAPPEPAGAGAPATTDDEPESVFAGFTAPADAAEASTRTVGTLAADFSDLLPPPETETPSPSERDESELPDPSQTAGSPPGAFDFDPPDPAADAGLTLDPAPVPVSSDEGFDTLLHLDDDLLPTHKPKRGLTVPSLGVGRLARPLKLLVVLLVVGVAGFVGSRALAGGGGDEAATDAPEGVAGAGTVQLGDLPVSGALDPRDAGAVINSVQLVGAEAELRTAATSAQAHYAETGSFALPPAQWTDLVGRTVVDGTSGPPAPGLLRVLSDDDAVCFETATDAGATVAVGVIDGTLGFASDPAGGSVCTLDAAVLAGWQPSLVGL